MVVIFQVNEVASWRSATSAGITDQIPTWSD